MMAAPNSSVRRMRLGALLAGLGPVAPAQDCWITGLSLDSRTLSEGQLFLACRGSSGHGLDHLEQALQRGVGAVAWEPDRNWDELRIGRLARSSGTPFVAVADLRRRAGEIAARFFGDPSRRLEVIGITGTNGKTSCSQFLAQALGTEAPCAIVGTLGTGFPGRLRSASHTTPDPVTLQARLAELEREGAAAVAMEVSSHALDQGRVAAVAFDIAVLTNLSRDHLDYHGDMQSYASAKQRLFLHRGLRCAVLNHDDPFGRELLPELPVGLDTVLYGRGPVPRLPDQLAGWVWAESIDTHPGGMRVAIRSSWGEGRLDTPLLGRFNASNLLAVLAVLLYRGQPLGMALRRLAQLRGVAGRMESFGGPGLPRVVVDYAHTPDALEQALEALREHGPGRLVCVFGCGGERDRGKRPLMGAVAEFRADRVVLTDDNPRGEDGDRIIHDILEGMHDRNRVLVERNRRQAIRGAIESCGPSDLVLVAGKGHETTQTNGQLVTPFSDREEVAEIVGETTQAVLPDEAAAAESVYGLTLSETAELIGGQLMGGDVRFSAVSTDTRTLCAGQLFVALQGARFDAHAHLAEAQTRGAVAAMVSRDLTTTLPLLRVPDTRVGLGKLAAVWRRRFGRRVLAVTGSNGKTTVKEMLTAILGRTGPVLATRGNLNNDIGVPLTLLGLQGQPYAVVEMGANHPGEIGYLSHLARPDLVLLNNVGAAHLEGFGNLEGVARAKGEIIDGLVPSGVVVLNADDPWAVLWRELAASHRVLGFGMGAAAEVRARSESVKIRWQEDGFRCLFALEVPVGSIDVELALGGRHNVMNALAAAAGAWALGVDLDDIRNGLAAVRPVKGRLQTRLGGGGLRVIDDTYNANPDSVAAAVELLSSAPGERWLVLGDLAELGSGSERLHEELGRRVRNAGIERLFTLGSASAAAARGFGPGASHFGRLEELLAALSRLLPAPVCVLVKGSRSARMERVADALVQEC